MPESVRVFDTVLATPLYLQNMHPQEWDLLDLVTTAVFALGMSLGTDQACNKHLLNELMGSFCVFRLNLEGVP